MAFCVMEGSLGLGDGDAVLHFEGGGIGSWAWREVICEVFALLFLDGVGRRLSEYIYFGGVAR